MPWQFYTDVDDTLSDWFKSMYTPYRNALTPDPSVLPVESEIDWDSYWAGVNSTSFIVLEDTTDLTHLGLGVSRPELSGVQVIRVTHRWIGAGKSPYITQFREFITRKIYENLSPIPNVLSNGGIIWMLPTQSRVFQDTKSAQEDFWTLEIRLATKVLNTIV